MLETLIAAFETVEDPRREWKVEHRLLDILVIAVSAEIRHHLSSARLPPEALAAAIRDHWRVENGLHWVLDVTFREDASRVRERNAARNLALLRKVALNFARADTTLKASLKGKRKYAGWDDTFMAALIAG